MIRSRIYIVCVALFMVFGSYPIYFAAAGETYKIKASSTSINTKWHEIEVGDVEGHVIGLYQNTQVWVVDESTGEKSTQFSRGTMDFNRKTGQGTLKGYGLMTYASGDKRWASIEGKLVAKGKWVGRFTSFCICRQECFFRNGGSPDAEGSESDTVASLQSVHTRRVPEL